VLEEYLKTAGTHYKTMSQIYYDGLVHPSTIGYFAGEFLYLSNIPLFGIQLKPNPSSPVPCSHICVTSTKPREMRCSNLIPA